MLFSVAGGGFSHARGQKYAHPLAQRIMHLRITTCGELTRARRGNDASARVRVCVCVCVYIRRALRARARGTRVTCASNLPVYQPALLVMARERAELCSLSLSLLRARAKSSVKSSTVRVCIRVVPIFPALSRVYSMRAWIYKGPNIDVVYCSMYIELIRRAARARL